MTSLVDEFFAALEQRGKTDRARKDQRRAQDNLEARLNVIRTGNQGRIVDANTGRAVTAQDQSARRQAQARAQDAARTPERFAKGVGMLPFAAMDAVGQGAMDVLQTPLGRQSVRNIEDMRRGPPAAPPPLDPLPAAKRPAPSLARSARMAGEDMRLGLAGLGAMASALPSWTEATTAAVRAVPEIGKAMVVDPAVNMAQGFTASGRLQEQGRIPEAERESLRGGGGAAFTALNAVPGTALVRGGARAVGGAMARAEGAAVNGLARLPRLPAQEVGIRRPPVANMPPSTAMAETRPPSVADALMNADESMSPAMRRALEQERLAEIAAENAAKAGKQTVGYAHLPNVMASRPYTPQRFDPPIPVRGQPSALGEMRGAAGERPDLGAIFPPRPAAQGARPASLPLQGNAPGGAPAARVGQDYGPQPPANDRGLIDRVRAELGPYPVTPNTAGTLPTKAWYNLREGQGANQTTGVTPPDLARVRAETRWSGLGNAPTRNANPFGDVEGNPGRSGVGRAPRLSVKQEGDTTILSTPQGRIRARVKGDRLQIDHAGVNAADRGRGHGVALYEGAFAHAQKLGKALASDGAVTPEAARVYEALARRGYTVSRNPTATMQGSYLRSVDGEPVFTVTASGGRPSKSLVAGEGNAPQRNANPFGDVEADGGGRAPMRARQAQYRKAYAEGKRDEPFSDPRLTDAENKAVEMRRNGYSTAEIADEMESTENAVYKMIHMAKRKAPDVDIPTAYATTDSQANIVAKALLAGKSKDQIRREINGWRSTRNQEPITEGSLKATISQARRTLQPRDSNNLAPLGIGLAGSVMAAAGDAEARQEGSERPYDAREPAPPYYAPPASRTQQLQDIPPDQMAGSDRPPYYPQPPEPPIGEGQGLSPLALAGTIAGGLIGRRLGMQSMAPAVARAQRITRAASPRRIPNATQTVRNIGERPLTGLEAATRSEGRVRQLQGQYADVYAGFGGGIGGLTGATADENVPLEQKGLYALGGAAGGALTSRLAPVAGHYMDVPARLKEQGISRLPASYYKRPPLKQNPRYPILLTPPPPGAMRRDPVPNIDPAEAAQTRAWGRNGQRIDVVKRTGPVAPAPRMISEVSERAGRWSPDELRRAQSRTEAAGAEPMNRTPPQLAPPPRPRRTVGGKTLEERAASGKSVGPHFRATPAQGGYGAKDVEMVARTLGLPPGSTRAANERIIREAFKKATPQARAQMERKLAGAGLAAVLLSLSVGQQESPDRGRDPN